MLSTVVLCKVRVARARYVFKKQNGGKWPWICHDDWCGKNNLGYGSCGTNRVPHTLAPHPIKREMLE